MNENHAQEGILNKYFQFQNGIHPKPWVLYFSPSIYDSKTQPWELEPVSIASTTKERSTLFQVRESGRL